MCRNLKTCSYIEDRSKIVDAPAIRPQHFDEVFSEFVDSALSVKQGKSSRSQLLVSRESDQALHEWFCDHAQFAYKFRSGGTKHIPIQDVEIDPLRLGAKKSKEVNRRDNFRCRYCGHPVLPTDIFRNLSNLVGQESFQFKGKNSKRHGIRLVFGATADHVVPWADGGRTSDANLVAACWPCNFGKYNYTLDELGMTNPLERHIQALDSRVERLLIAFDLDSHLRN